jgi:hypothetical protein
VGKIIKNAFVALAAVLAGLGLVTVLSGAANAATRGHRAHITCSGTNPEFLLGDNGMSYTHRGLELSAHPRYGGWTDAYWTAGWDDYNSLSCGRTDQPGGSVGSTTVYGDLSAPATSGYVRLGFDLWLTPGGNVETPSQMESRGSTWEIMVDDDGSSGVQTACTQYGCWHRVYVNSWRSGGWVNLTSIAERYGLRGYRWDAIDAGGETPGGSFQVTGYSLHVHRPAPPHRSPSKAHGKPKPRPKPVKHHSKPKSSKKHVVKKGSK